MCNGTKGKLRMPNIESAHINAMFDRLRSRLLLTLYLSDTNFHLNFSRIYQNLCHL